MVQINFASREVNCKIVYYGPGRCGKTTNLQLVHEKAPANSTGELVSIATETDRTLYFDFLPLDLGTVAGMRTKFQLYTVPGQVYYDATRKLVLQGCDGIVFVADSNPDLMAENIESLDNLAKNLRENGLDLMDVPMVLQFNKRDLPNAMSIDEMNTKLNRNNWATVEAVAVNGDGVFQTLKAISQGVIKRLNREQGFTDDGQRKGGRPSAMGANARGVATATKGPSTTPSVAPGRLGPARTMPSPGPKTAAAAVAPRTAMAGVASKTATPPALKTAKTPTAPVAARRSFDAPGHGGEMGAPKAAANPFRDRLAEIKKQSAAPMVEEADVAPESEDVVITEAGAPARGGIGWMAKVGLVAVLLLGAAFIVLVKMGLIPGIKF